MSTDYSDSNTESKSRPFEKAETSNSRPANPHNLAYLFSVAMYALGKGEPVALRSDEATALFRIAAGKGAPVELFKIQNDPGDGKGFMAMLTPRIHSLRHRYGFNISNRTDRDPGCNRSWYWLELDGDGCPKMNAVELAQPQTGKPKTTPRTAKHSATLRQSPLTPIGVEPPPQDEHGQSLLFGDMRPARSSPCKSFDQLERGA